MISFYELGERTPTPENLIRLARIFHVSCDYLLGLDKEDTIDISQLSEADKAFVRKLVERLEAES